MVPVLLATLLSYLTVFDISFVFPILLLIGSIFVNWVTIYLAISYFIKTARKSFFEIISKSFNFIRQDIVQIGYVFMGISLVSSDKWLLQYFSQAELPMYMLYTQIASVFIVAQTIVLIAPVRARLINENPQEIKAIKIGSPIFSVMPLLIGIALYYYNFNTEGNGNIQYFAFFFAAIVTFTVAYAERLYWVTTAWIRLTLDLVIGTAFILPVVFLAIFWPSPNLIIVCLILLFCLMCIRVLVMMYLLSKNKVFKTN